MYRYVEIQLGQIANTINNRNQGELPRKIEMNPREHMKVIILHNGKQLSESPIVEKMREDENKENKRGSELVKESKKSKKKKKRQSGSDGAIDF